METLHHGGENIFFYTNKIFEHSYLLTRKYFFLSFFRWDWRATRSFYRIWSEVTRTARLPQRNFSFGGSRLTPCCLLCSSHCYLGIMIKRYSIQLFSVLRTLLLVERTNISEGAEITNSAATKLILKNEDGRSFDPDFERIYLPISSLISDSWHLPPVPGPTYWVLTRAFRRIGFNYRRRKTYHHPDLVVRSRGPWNLPNHKW